MSLALARKWRPKTFSELVGQSHVVTALTNAISQGRMHHAWLFTGTRGVGKTTLARIIAKALNCEALSNADPCGRCDSCLLIDQSRFVDVIELDAASNTQVDNMRDLLELEQSTDLVLAIGTSLAGMNADRVFHSCARRSNGKNTLDVS
jgi:DNA polymerase-3 subunit gamma/tau